jgi:hypothetical protein
VDASRARPETGILDATDVAALRQPNPSRGAFARIFDRLLSRVTARAPSLSSSDRESVVVETLARILLALRDPGLDLAAVETALGEALVAAERAARERVERDRAMWVAEIPPSVDGTFQLLVLQTLALDRLPPTSSDVLVEAFGLNQVGIPLVDGAPLRFRKSREREEARKQALWEFSDALERVLVAAREGGGLDSILLEQALDFVRGLSVANLLELFADRERVT